VTRPLENIIKEEIGKRKEKIGNRKEEIGKSIRETTPPASPERERWRAGMNTNEHSQNKFPIGVTKTWSFVPEFLI